MTMFTFEYLVTPSHRSSLKPGTSTPEAVPEDWEAGRKMSTHSKQATEVMSPRLNKVWAWHTKLISVLFVWQKQKNGAGLSLSDIAHALITGHCVKWAYLSLHKYFGKDRLKVFGRQVKKLLARCRNVIHGSVHILWKAEAGRQVVVRTIEPFPTRRLLSGVSC